MFVDVVTDGRDQVLDVAEDSAAKAVLREVTEEPLHHVEPRTAGRREVDVEAGMAGEPLLHLGMFVGCVVICDKVNLLGVPSLITRRNLATPDGDAGHSTY